MALVTLDQVRKAAAELTARGVVPTPKAVFDHLGGHYSAASIKVRLQAVASEAARGTVVQCPPSDSVKSPTGQEHRYAERLRRAEFALYRLSEELRSERKENEDLRKRFADSRDQVNAAEKLNRVTHSELSVLEAECERLREAARVHEPYYWELCLLRWTIADLCRKRLAYRALRIRPVTLEWPEVYPLTPENPTIEHPIIVSALHRVSQYEERLKRDYPDQATYTAVLSERDELSLTIRGLEYQLIGMQCDKEKLLQRLSAKAQKKSH